MNPYWTTQVCGLTPYVPGEQPKEQNLIKLNTNENPYPPSVKVLDAIKDATEDSLRLYPDPESTVLIQALADHHNVLPEQVFVGNGSDEVLAHIFQALLKHDAPLVFPDISYSFYPVYCDLYDIEFKTAALDDEFGIHLDSYPSENGGVIFPNPNAPTGKLLSLDEIDRFVASNQQSVVVVDEAYIDFGGESAVALVSKYNNLVVAQTFSKSRSLAGLRVGYAIADVELIDALNRVKNSFNSYPLDRLAQAGALASLEDQAYFEQTCSQIIQNRTALVAGLEKLGFEVVPSNANFVFATHPDKSAEVLAEQLREKKIIVRHFKHPRIKEYLRITVGSEGECHSLLVALFDL